MDFAGFFFFLTIVSTIMAGIVILALPGVLAALYGWPFVLMYLVYPIVMCMIGCLLSAEEDPEEVEHHEGD